MAFGNNYGGYQPLHNPTGAMQDTLNQFKGQYQPMNQPQIIPGAQQPTAPQIGNPLWVQGEAGAKSFCVAPGQNVLLMDSEAQRFYIKSADASGMPLPLRTFEYKEITGAPTVAASGEEGFVTRREFEERLAKLTTEQEEIINE